VDRICKNGMEKKAAIYSVAGTRTLKNLTERNRVARVASISEGEEDKDKRKRESE